MIKLAGIWNVNSTYNVNNKRISTKLSFEIGQKFLARVMDLDKVSKGILLRLLDGWQFPAAIENLGEISQGQLLAFQVDGFQDGKLKLKIVTGTNEEVKNGGKDAVKLFIKENSMNLSTEDYDLVKNMIKHEIPLTKDNISNIKSLLEFMNKVKTDDGEEDNFIQKYLLSKNVAVNSTEGERISSILKDFFTNIEKLNSKDIFTFIENNIDVNNENIKSFNDVFKKPTIIYREIEALGERFGKNVQPEIKQNSENVKSSTDDYINVLQKNIEKAYKNVDSSEIAAVKQNVNDVTDSKESTLKNYPLDGDEKATENISKSVPENLKIAKNEIEKGNNIKQINIDQNENVQNNIDKDAKSDVKIDIKNEIKNIFSDYVSKGKTNLISKDLIESIANQVKEQVNFKTREMSDVIEQAINQIQDKNSDKPANIISFLNNNMNDFKIFNTISNSYYYMDLPLKLQNNNYECKLIIKDHRKRGKKIDSSDVKIATSINTENMGVVDAYLTVKNKNMHIDVKSQKSFIKLLENHSEKILESLSNLGYNIDIDFSEKQEEMNISTCRDFFQDNEIGIINTRV
ncbi:hypothetical protein ACSVC9_15735 [Clostridium sp. LBM24168]